MNDEVRSGLITFMTNIILAFFFAMMLHDLGLLGFDLFRGETLRVFGFGVTLTLAVFSAASTIREIRENNKN